MTIRLVSGLLIVALLGLPKASLQADADPPVKSKSQALATPASATAKARAESIDQAVARLSELIAQPMPKGLSPDNQQQWAEQTTWFTNLKDRYSSFGQSKGLNGGDMIQEMAAMNKEFLALQTATQKESRRFQVLSNASKARHEIAMNAIQNIK